MREEEEEGQVGRDQSPPLKKRQVLHKRELTIFESVLDEILSVLSSLSLCHFQLETISQTINGWSTLETWEISSDHQRTNLDDLFSIRSTSQESFSDQFREDSESLRISTSHNFHHFVRQLEGVWFELHSSSCE